MSKKINTNERHIVYKKTLEAMTNRMSYAGHVSGVCSCIQWAVKGHISDTDFVRRRKHLHIENYPELMEYKPPHNENNDYWFPLDFYGYQTRVKILESAIDKTKPI